MKAARYTRKTLPREFRDTKLWAKASIKGMSRDQKRRFIRLAQAMKAYLLFEPVSQIEKKYRVNRKQLVTLLNRCMTLVDARPLGWPGLIRYLRCQPYTREAEFKAGTERGYAGALEKLLNTYPAILPAFVARVLKKAKRGDRRAFSHKDTADVIQGEFLAICGNEAVPATWWPHIAARKGRRTIVRLAKKIVMGNWPASLRASGLVESAYKAKLGGTKEARVFALAPYDVVQFDGHRLHCVGTLKVKSRRGWTFVPLQRVTIILILEVFSEAILGYYVAVRREPRARDIVRAKENALKRWEPVELTIPGLKYDPGAGLPSGVIPGLDGVAWAQEQFDNALSNLADLTIFGALDRIGTTLNLGGFGEWVRREAIERVHQRLEQYGFARAPSSTGTGVGDPSIQDANKKAVKEKIEHHELIQIIDVVVANLNRETNEGMGHKSALSVLRDFLATDQHFLPRRLPPLASGQAPLGITIEVLVVAGDYKEGRRPYIQYNRVRYTNELLASSPASIIGTPFECHIDEDDPRTMHVYFLDGREFGVLRARGYWGITPHTLEDRRHINSLLDSGELKVGPNDDPMEVYCRYLGKKVTEEADAQKDNRPRTSRTATKVAEIQTTGRWIEPKMEREPRDNVQRTQSQLPLRQFSQLKRPSGNE
jgi:hypothetical protein